MIDTLNFKEAPRHWSNIEQVLAIELACGQCLPLDDFDSWPVGLATTWGDFIKERGETATQAETIGDLARAFLAWRLFKLTEMTAVRIEENVA